MHRFGLSMRQHQMHESGGSITVAKPSIVLPLYGMPFVTKAGQRFCTRMTTNVEVNKIKDLSFKPVWSESSRAEYADAQNRVQPQRRWLNNAPSELEKKVDSNFGTMQTSPSPRASAHWRDRVTKARPAADAAA